MLPEKDNKNQIVNKLKQYNKRADSLNLSFLKSQFDIFDNLINILIEDPHVSYQDNNYLHKLLNFFKRHRKTKKINKINIKSPMSLAS